MDSGHHYQAALLWLLKHSASMQVMLVALWHHFCHDNPMVRDSWRRVTLKVTLSLV
jgi:hypothetical protein